ncbi:hypothetical protein [Streptomyces sp. bgisy034]|uniref:hypothetical protein n=1 Tax=Streptomyces sp. bgisy034 TaxID=3413774 RepID=UPI003EC0CA0E
MGGRTREAARDRDAGGVRLPCDPSGDETVTHWAEPPTLPGGKTHGGLGKDVEPALRNAWSARPLT